MDLLVNRFLSSPFSTGKFRAYARPLTGTLNVVSGGVLMDPFYRNAEERPHSGRGRSSHLGADITGSGSGDRSIADPRRGQAVYAAIKTQLSVEELNSVRAFNKDTQTLMTGVGLSGSGAANMSAARIFVQPWSSQEDHAYGGIIGFSCIYDYSGGQFTLYIEFLHLITPSFLPKDANGRIADAAEWQATGRGIGFGPDMQNNADVPPSFFQGGTYPLVGYLGATQTPHVHVQAAFFPRRTFDKRAVIRVDPMIVVY